MVQGKINRGRHSDHPAGCHSIRTYQCLPPPSPNFFYRPDALHAAQPTVSKHWSKGKIHTGNATDASNVTATITVRFQVQQKFRILTQVNSRTFSGLSQTGIIYKKFQGLEIATIKFKSFKDEQQPCNFTQWVVYVTVLRSQVAKCSSQPLELWSINRRLQMCTEKTLR